MDDAIIYYTSNQKKRRNIQFYLFIYYFYKFQINNDCIQKN
jgi:hypothetical protein